jgi:hypothetical protein
MAIPRGNSGTSGSVFTGDEGKGMAESILEVVQLPFWSPAFGSKRLCDCNQVRFRFLGHPKSFTSQILIGGGGAGGQHIIQPTKKMSTRKTRQRDETPSRQTSEGISAVAQEVVEKLVDVGFNSNIPPPAKRLIPPPAKPRAISVEPSNSRATSVEPQSSVKQPTEHVTQTEHGKQHRKEVTKGPKISTILALSAIAALSGGAFLHQNPHHLPEPVRNLPQQLPEHWDRVKNSINLPSLPETDWPVVPEQVKKQWEATTGAVWSGLDQAKDKANQVSEGTRKAAADAFDKTREGFAYHGGNVKDKLAYHGGNVKEKAGKGAETLKSSMQNILDSLPSFDLGGKATKELQERLIALEAKIEEQMTKLSTRDEVQQELANFQEEVKSIQSKVHQVGTQIQDEVGEKLQQLDENRKTTEEKLKLADEKLKFTDEKLKSTDDKLSTVVWEMEKRALDAVERQLPARLFVRKDPKTGKIDFDPEFWITLKERLESSGLTRPMQVVVGHDGEPLEGDSAKVATLAAQQATENIIKHMHIESLSKEQVLDLIRGELKSIPNNMQRGAPGELAGKEGEFLANLQHLVDKKLERFAADTIAMPDYALESAGAHIITDLTSPTYERRPTKPISGLLSRALGVGVVEGRPPAEAIRRGNNMGECWAMNGIFSSQGD